MHMTILSVDQSFTSSGIVTLADDGRVLASELFKSNAERDVFHRAWQISEHIATIAHNVQARFVALEGLAYAKAGDATRDLAGLQFVITCSLRYLYGLHVEIVFPTTAKKFATGKGNSNKEALLEHLPDDVRDAFDRIGVKKTTGLLDLTDAYWIGRTALETVPKDYVSKPEQDTLDEATEQAICDKLREQTGYDARVNPNTYAPELYVDGQWIEIQLAE